MDWIEVEGGTREEAEKKALEILKAADLDSIEIEEIKVIRKFMGVGGRTHKIRARHKVTEAPQAPQYGVGETVSGEPPPKVIEEEKPEEAPPEKHEEKSTEMGEMPEDIVTFESKYRPWVAEGPGGALIPLKGRGYGGRLYHPEPLGDPAPPQDKAAGPAADTRQSDEIDFAPPVYKDEETSPVSDEVKAQAVEFIQKILDDMGITGTATGYKLADRLLIQITSDEAGLLIGHKGETLESLQYLVDIIVNRNLEHRIRIVLDTENYREKRKHKIFEIAKKGAKDAARLKKSVALAPMNPSERRLVHTSLANDATVETRSEGEGHRRRVVIHPVGRSNKKSFNQQKGRQRRQ